MKKKLLYYLHRCYYRSKLQLITSPVKRKEDVDNSQLIALTYKKRYNTWKY